MAKKKNKPLSDRATAALVLEQVVGFRHSLSTELEVHLPRLRDSRDRAFAQYLCYGVMRWLPKLEAILEYLLKRPLKTQDEDIRCLLLSGLFQYINSRVPDYAATSETVAAARELNKSWACGLVNAVLRRFLRERDKLLEDFDNTPITHFAYPHWWLQQFQDDWPEQWEALAEAGNAQPPMTLRARISRTAYIEKLDATDMAFQKGVYSPSALILEKPVDVNELPGFNEGEVSVQDEAAQLAGLLLDVEPGMRVLDACAAPGGKTAHILELDSNIELFALDNDRARLAQIEDTLKRLSLSATMYCGDAGQPADWWDGRHFDRILLDAPCSASGVIRRHPDIKHLRRQEDLSVLVEEQARLLIALWPLLADNGKLLYATCSIFPQENAQQISDFLIVQKDAVDITPTVDWGHKQTAGRQILSGEAGMDGFYYALLMKHTA